MIIFCKLPFYSIEIKRILNLFQIVIIALKIVYFKN